MRYRSTWITIVLFAASVDCAHRVPMAPSRANETVDNAFVRAVIRCESREMLTCAGIEKVLLYRLEANQDNNVNLVPTPNRDFVRADGSKVHVYTDAEIEPPPGEHDAALVFFLEWQSADRVHV